MREILADLVAEQQSLDQLLQRAPDRIWKLATPADGWTIQDTIAHLAWSERQAATVLGGDTSVFDEIDEYETLDDYIQSGVESFSGRRPQEVIEQWRFARADVVDALSRCKGDERVEWYGVEMSSKTFATSRLMETWAHGLDIHVALEREEVDTPRLRHIAWLGWKTLPHAFEAAGETYEPIRVELVGPAYARYVFGPEDAENVIRGSAGDWCRVVVRRMDAADAENLTATGEAAETALSVARAYL